MSAEALTAYLQEHAAGAAAAVDLLNHLISSHGGTEDETFFRDLRAEIEEDKTTLDHILAQFRAGESGVLNSMSRASEKLARAKFIFAGHGQGELGRLEAIEMLSLGIEGKHSLWRALEAAEIPELRTFDVPALAARAVQQREGVERRRLIAARGALGTANK
jgi:hypothetical protein